MKKLLYLFLVLGLFACSSDSADDDSPCPNQPQLTTYEVSNIDYDENTDLSSATFTAEIQNIQLGPDCETFSITNQGFVYGTNIQPTTSDNVVNGNGQNATANVTGLPTETTYYVRSYLTNVLGTFYGNEVSFITPESTNPIYLDENGVTIKARDWASVGDTGVVNGVTYTIVDSSILYEMNTNQEDVTVVCTTKITDMVGMFFAGTAFNQDISSWDVSNVTNMQQMFDSATSFNQDISSWDVSNVTNMRKMFFGGLFNQDISSWDVSNVTDMAGMFLGNPQTGAWNPFNQDISSWDVGNVTTMSGMFDFNDSFNQDISSWNVSNVTRMEFMFEYTPFNQDLSSWDVENVVLCYGFCAYTSNWTLPKPNFTNCSENLGCN